jgi:hypothetical protein
MRVCVREGDQIVAKFLLLYTGGGMPETEAEGAAVMAAWGAWYTSLGEAVADPGCPFTPVVQHIASDGSVSDGAQGTPASGYTVITAASFSHAVEAAKGCPHLKSGGQITVYEGIDMMM